ncbi:hypothetical protein RvY_12008-1 [Ramazzottius varieornatus]|uniref:CUT domain-containing protein n=1 Tax=Ramazzottius varieornatus TaxID=947166 RepID=A0A1D1VI35_RAMVA|nr:hypothetical protein RvY_12008-1 [Ramazzottius varieornatus]
MASSSAAVERWRKLDFRTLQNELDAAAADIAVKQEESDLGRRKLVELSRDFRQTAPEEVRRQVQPVLKSFQTEVDSLLKRCKGAETAFLHVYRTFADLPDPSSIIEQLDHLEEQLAENKQLRAAVEEYEAQQLANKTQEAKAAREDFEARVEAEVLERLKLASDQLTGQFAEAQAEWNSEKAAMERRVADAEDQVGILRRELDRSHAEASRARSIANTQSEDEKIALMTEDLERATERAATAECKISELEQQVTALSKQAEKTLDSSNNSPSANNSENGPQRAAQVSQHQQDAVQRLRDELDRLKRSYQVQFDRMEDQLSRLTAQNTLLLRKLDAQRDYDEMKQQLSLLKAAQYSDDLTGGSLESILAARNRRLENENVALRVRESELAGFTTRLSSHLYTNGNGVNVNGVLARNGHNSSEGERDHDSSSPDREDEDTYSDIDWSDLESPNLTPEMSAKIAEAKAVLQNLHSRTSDKTLYTREVAAQVNRVLEEEGITRSALAKFVLNGSYKMVYDALHDPRDWTTLNAAGRDKYRKLKMWAENARCINAVKVLQVYCKDRRRRSEGENGEVGVYKNGAFSIHALIGSGGEGRSGERETLKEEPTDLSLPKSQQTPMPGNNRRKAFIPQRESLLGNALSDMDAPMYWPPKMATLPFHSAASFIPRRPPATHSPQKLGSPREPSQSPKRYSPSYLSSQSSTPRRGTQSSSSSRDVSSSSPLVGRSIAPPVPFKPSASFTASPVALGISFPDYRKNVLHQITDDMINQYDPLDTDVVTRAVRSKLNKCNVSQRLFGEVVLGMSQGAVSDLLKRPKPWNKLTRPTKEHYVRMQQFLEDENSIPVLQAIQNREDPERVLAAVGEDEEEKPDIREPWTKEDSPQLPTQAPPVNFPANNVPASMAPVITSAGREPVLSEAELSEREAFQAVKEHFAKFYQINDVNRSGGSLDTVAVAGKIKEELRSRNLQQKLIGELVLDVGQGTVSELLNKPKPYGMLSMKGRENYMKLTKLLQTGEDFALLEALRAQGQQKGSSKRSRGSSDGESSCEKRSRLDESDGTSGGDAENHLYDDLPNDKPVYHKYHSEEDDEVGSLDDEDGEIINGVCVPRSAMRGARPHDTVIVQPHYPKMERGQREHSWPLGLSLPSGGKNGPSVREGSHDGDDKDW